MVNIANLISLVRVALAFVALFLLSMPTDSLLWTACVLTALVIYGDALDGYLARKLNLSSRFGGVLDIASDRVVEMAYWIVFATLAWIPVWVPLLYLVRGTFVDGLRAQALEQGLSAFGEKTMMKSVIGRALVSSNFSRFSYALVKAAAFCLVIASHTNQLSSTFAPWLALACVYLSCAFCVVRGLPVLIEGLPHIMRS